MSIKWLYVTLIVAGTAVAQEWAPSVDLAAGDNDLLSLSWESESNAPCKATFPLSFYIPVVFLPASAKRMLCILDSLHLLDISASPMKLSLKA